MEISVNNRWHDLNIVLGRGGPLTPADFEPTPIETHPILPNVNILVIGAGGLGCELLKNLALSGFKNIHVIDMDTIDISNLNRQFLFRSKDIGKPKASVAAEFVMNRVATDVKVTAHFCRIQDFDEDFYRQFALIICGLDSIEARRWMNATVYRMYDPEDPSTIIPIIDGGTEGFKGQSRVIIPGQTSCYECSMDMLTPKVAFPLCTIANTPRLPEHCIEWASVLEWPRQFPDKKLDTDNPDHIKWLYETAQERAKLFNISGVTYSLAQGVVKNIIPAIASTNAIIAASCCNEAFKMVTSSAKLLDTYMMYTGDDGAYTYTFQHEKKPDCQVCGNEMLQIEVCSHWKLSDLIEHLKTHPSLQLKKPSIRTSEKSLYMQAPPQLEEMTRPNLDKKLTDLISMATDKSHAQLTVTDPSLPIVLNLKVKLTA